MGTGTWALLQFELGDSFPLSILLLLKLCWLLLQFHFYTPSFFRVFSQPSKQQEQPFSSGAMLLAWWYL
jgi:hypothetical protein